MHQMILQKPLNVWDTLIPTSKYADSYVQDKQHMEHHAQPMLLLKPDNVCVTYFTSYTKAVCPQVSSLWNLLSESLGKQSTSMAAHERPYQDQTVKFACLFMIKSGILFYWGLPA